MEADMFPISGYCTHLRGFSLSGLSRKVVKEFDVAMVILFEVPVSSYDLIH